MSINVESFEKELTKILNQAKEARKEYIDITSKELHTKVGEYPGKNHVMPTCCSVMRKMMKKNDFIKNQPPKGNGASLEIRYYIE
ncbi:hypothetical protein [Clostridium sp.]|uniref:hypothetical protein n=1 Tax=Clostridium sp. TaxID=1506 RepID=UPI0029088C1C|nr:hypothetical protein [Clostridium sp.]MDU6542885.1 hypothetical protein [Clostridium sp.]